MRQIYNRGDKKVYKDDKTGDVKEIHITNDDKVAIKEGAALQPHGKDESRFFAINKHLTKKKSGEIVEKSKEAERKKDANMEYNRNLEEAYNAKKKKEGPGWKMYY